MIIFTDKNNKIVGTQNGMKRIVTVTPHGCDPKDVKAHTYEDKYISDKVLNNLTAYKIVRNKFIKVE